MNIKILLLGMITMLVSNALVLGLVSYFHLRSFISMGLITLILFIFWYLFLKKDIPILTNKINARTLKDTSALVFIPVLGAIYLLYVTSNVEYGLVSLMLLTSLATGVYEEIIFRSITLGALLNSGVKPYRSILVSALIFSIFHLYSAYQYESIDIALKMLNTFMMGVILAYIYFISRNIFYVITIHTIWDFQSFLANSYIVDNIGASIAIILFAMTIYYFLWSYKKMLKL